tara:strand:- start:19 stop:747 length:729 start_codon:yes stop_codon:yes gene_type:complete
VNNFFSKKSNLIFITIYFCIVILFYNYFFSFQFSKTEILNFFIKNKEQLDFYINNNFAQLTLYFILFSILWTICLGFGLPTMMIAAYLFSPINGTIILVSAKTIGVVCLYFIYKKTFFRSISKKSFLKKINRKNFFKYFKTNELYCLILLRLFPGIPVQFVDIFPLIMNVKFKSYLISKFIGSLIPHFIIINLINKFYENFENNLNAEFNLTVSKELLLAFIIFGFFIIISNLFKKKLKFFK